MNIQTKIRELVAALLENMHEKRKMILVLSCFVVFVTTYMLILPAFTLDKEEASEQGGVDVPGVEQSADADGTTEDHAEATSEDIKKEESAEESSEDVKKEAVAKTASEKPAKSSKTEASKSDAKKKSTDITLENDESDDFSVAVESKEAVLSEDMSVAVREIDKSDKKQKKEYDSLYNDALEAVQKVQEEEGQEKPSDFAFAKFYDISLMDGDTEVEPDAAVDVKISFSKDLQKELKVADPERVHIVHFAVDKESGEVTPEVLDTKSTDITVENKKIAEAAFTTDSFSVFAVVYTVDFLYDIDGKQYDFSMDGGESISLKTLVETLKVTDDAEAFVSNVEKAEFSNPELVWVGKVDSDTTIGELKRANGLESEYSAELTKKEIAEIDAQTVNAGDWALISLKPFTSEETLMVTMKNGEVLKIDVTDAQLKKTVISDSGKTWEITVTYGEDAQIPADSELQVREITEKDKKYSSLCENAQNKLQQEGTELQEPVLFDISIVNNGKKVEPAENSNVKVDVKLVRSSLSGIYTDEDAPLLVNDEPLTQKNGEIDQDVQIVHQLEDGDIELVDTEDVVGEEDITSSFTTDSFSDWLLFLDETVENITIGVNDTLTLRPYSKWVWKSTEEEEQYANYEWRVPQNSNIISFSRERKYDDQLREEYYYYHGQATRQGNFDIQLVDGNTVKHTIHVNVVNDVPDIPAAITDTADIKINLFDYDINANDSTKSGSLDAKGNTAAHPYSNTVNNGHDLKFLGWGGGNVDGWSINNYSQDVPNPGIVQNRLTNGYPKLSTGSNQSLDYLFNTSSNNSSVKAYPGVNGLFQFEDGYYFYNSNSNYAYYNSSNNTFTLYEHTYSQWTNGTAGQTQSGSGHNAKPIGFFPFHKYDSYLKEGNIGMNYNTNLNHHFGMDMTVDFEIPSDGLDDNGNPIVFEFSGDDDMWVFIDDNLVLDVGGIHQPVTGKINFSSDKVEVFGSPDTTISQRFRDANSPKAWEIGDGKPHTMKIFYLERGGCDSNLSIKFNTPVRYGKGKLSLVKREKNTTTPLKNAKFGIWDNAKCQGDPIEYTTDANGKIDFGEFVLKSATTTFYLKEIKEPDGYVLDTDVYQIKPRLNNGVAVKDNNGYVILDVFDKDGHALTKLENDSVVFPNTKIGKISIPAKKNWQGGTDNNTTVTLTIKRYKLIDKVKGFMIIKELWNEPDDYNFEALYKIYYPNGTQKTVSYNEFSNGIYGIEDAVPGEYIIEEDVRSTAPDGYHMEHTQQSLRITLEEDGTALANFKTTFIRDTGQLIIKENVTAQGGNAADIDHSSIRYAVLDESGKKVTSVTHAQAVEGVTLDLPVGTYSVKAVSVPDEPYNYERTEQYVVSGSLRQNGTVLNNIRVTSTKTQVDFYTTYVKLNNAQNCKWAIRDQYPPYNRPNYKTGMVDYPVGTKLMMTFQIPQGQVYDTNGNYDVSYNGQTLTPSKSNVQSNYEFEVEFTVVENAELVFRVNGVDLSKNVTIYGPRFEVIEHAPHTHSGRMMLFAKRPTAAAPLARNAQNEATHSEAPEGKKYVKDSDWSATVTLNSNNNWEDNDTLKDLPATDNEGNKYYYYVDSVNETGAPEGTICNIDLDGESLYLVGQDLHPDGTLSVTNILTGSLKITKKVTVNRAEVTDHSKASPADGTYSFTITKDGEPIDGSPIEITITNGVVESTEVENLSPGTYRVTETQPTNGATLDKINEETTTQNYFDIVVQAGKTGNNAPNVTFTNNIVDTKIKVIKVEKDTETPVPGAKFKLTRVDDEGHDITTPGESYSHEEEVDPTTGELEFTGLKNGRYRLEETLVPDGYIKTEQFYFITIDKNGKGGLDTSIPHEMISPDSGNVYTVENEPGAELPHTGGSGTTMIYILGLVLTTIAAAGFVIGRRRKAV